MNFFSKATRNTADVENSDGNNQRPSSSAQSSRTIRLTNRGGVFTATDVRFTANGVQHVVTISLKKHEQGGSTMALVIDGERVYNVEITKSKLQGGAEFQLADRMAVDFFWDIKKTPMEFLFRTKIAGKGSEIYEEWKEEQEGYYSVKFMCKIG